jgi:uncharacterized protein YbjQ (UPF0145 family)
MKQEKNIMILVNTGTIPGKEYEVIGLLKGSTVRGTVKDIFAKLQNFAGKEMKGYAEMLNDMRYLATQRMMAEAQHLDADAVLNVTYTSTQIIPGTIEVMVYGTAVRFID